jgi:predicted transcriptional regulator
MVPASTSITVRCTSAQRLELQRVAHDTRRDMAGIIREAINVFVNDYGGHQVFPRRR